MQTYWQRGQLLHRSSTVLRPDSTQNISQKYRFCFPITTLCRRSLYPNTCRIGCWLYARYVPTPPLQRVLRRQSKCVYRPHRCVKSEPSGVSMVSRTFSVLGLNVGGADGTAGGARKEFVY